MDFTYHLLNAIELSAAFSVYLWRVRFYVSISWDTCSNIRYFERKKCEWNSIKTTQIIFTADDINKLIMMEVVTKFRIDRHENTHVWGLEALRMLKSALHSTKMSNVKGRRTFSEYKGDVESLNGKAVLCCKQSHLSSWLWWMRNEFLISTTFSQVAHFNVENLKNAQGQASFLFQETFFHMASLCCCCDDFTPRVHKLTFFLSSTQCELKKSMNFPFLDWLNFATASKFQLPLDDRQLVCTLTLSRDFNNNLLCFHARSCLCNRVQLIKSSM